MHEIRFYEGNPVPVEMYRARIVQQLNLLPVEERLRAIRDAGFNTFLLKNRDTFLDMLTDSGVNAMSDRQQAAMMMADDSYAGSETFERLDAKVREIFGTRYFLPAHQGRACEHIIAQTLVFDGAVVPTNYHFTTTKAHIERCGGEVVEIHSPDAFDPTSSNPFKGNMPADALQEFITATGKDRIPFVRMEAGTNLIGGQPFSIANLRAVSAVCRANSIPLVLDASLLADNLYFINVREAEFADATLREITRAIIDLCDITYFSARKLGHARGGGICTSNHDAFRKMRELVPLFEGFLTYGGMSVREIEAITVGLDETMDFDMVRHGPEFVAHMVGELVARNIPVVTPPGGLGAHIDAMRFVDHIPQEQYPAGALATALFIASGVRGMERGTLSESRRPDGTETLANMELLRLALPRRVFTLSQVSYTVDRLTWLYENRHLIEGLRFVDEPKVLRFFIGRLEPVSDWPQRLVSQFREDFGETL